AALACDFDHPGREVDAVEASAGREILERIPDEPRPATEIENPERRLQLRQFGIRQSAHMQMAAIAELVDHQMVEPGRHIVEHLAERKVGDTADFLELQKDEETIAPRRLEVRPDRKGAVVA